jgi:hypothetical protein
MSMKENNDDKYVLTARLANRASRGRADCADESSTDTSGDRSRRDSSRSSTADAAIGRKKKLSSRDVDADPRIADPSHTPPFIGSSTAINTKTWVA